MKRIEKETYTPSFTSVCCNVLELEAAALWRRWSSRTSCWGRLYDAVARDDEEEVFGKRMGRPGVAEEAEEVQQQSVAASAAAASLTRRWAKLWTLDELVTSRTRVGTSRGSP